MKRIPLIRIWLVALLLFVFHDFQAANLYWYGHTSTTFSTASNWSTSNTGYSAASAAPGSSDVANYGNYTGITNANCSLTGSINVQGINFVSGYAGTFTQGANAITVGSGNAVFSAGTFSGGSSSITVNGTFTVSGCTFTSTSNTLSASGGFTISSGSFTNNSGVVSLTATQTLTVSNTGGSTFYKLSFAPTSTATYTITSTTTITVSNLLSYDGSAAITLNSGTINVTGNVKVTNRATGGGGSATIAINSTTVDQTLTGNGLSGGGVLPIVSVTKSAKTLTLDSIISIAGNFSINSGVMTAGTSTVVLKATSTLTVANSGGTSFYKLSFAPTSSATYTITSTTTTTVSNLLSYDGSAAITLNSGTINVTGNVKVTNRATGGGGSATIALNSTTADQTLTGNGLLGSGILPIVSVTKSAKTLTLDSIISIAGNFTINSGVMTAGTSTIALTATSTLTVANSGGTSFYKLSFAPVSSATYTITSTTTTTVSNLLSYDGSNSAAITLNSGTINVTGNVKVTNRATGGGGSATIAINSTSADQTLTGNGLSGGGALPIVSVTKSAKTLTLDSIISISGNFTINSGVMTAGTSTVVLTGASNPSTLTVANSGGTSFYKLSFAPTATTTYIITSTTTTTVSNLLSFDGSAAITLNTGTINATGDFTITNTVAGGGGSATIIFNGAGTQNFTGSGTANVGLTPNITIDKTSGRLILFSIIGCAGNWTYNQGTVDATTNTSSVSINGNKNLDGQGSSTTMTFYKISPQSGTTTLTGNLIASNSVIIASGATLLGNGFNINVGSRWNNQGGTWTPGSGTVTFDGSSYGFITKSGGEVFGNLTINKTSTGVKLVSPVDITGTFTLTSGRLTTTTTNYLDLTSTASVSGGSNTAYVNGPMRKKGNTLFTFPIGDSSCAVPYHPLKISAPASSSDQFEAIYKPTVQTSGSALGTGIASISTCEYWTLERKAGTSTPTVSLSWNSNCDNGSYSEMRVVTWTGSQWSDLGQASVTATSPTGTVDGSSAETFGANPAPLTIGYATAIKSFAVIKKTLDGGCCLTEGKILYFGFDEEYKDADNLLTYKITNLSTDRTVTLSSSLGNAAPVSYGNNIYKIDLYDNTNTALPSGYYMLEVTNEKNEKWYLRFKI